ncbi:HD domain-containing protein [Deinococcus sp. HMF7604]|uniref:HD domain-containing phosphohydrolase n=1 Tax=Deinococcus betulae TaxID=2873312 RepID=UPI001CCC6B5B|nr:HD domain-containing phosphohydrolase [Deinococcus betulae]MBZ9751346.1 HD domain-containing protein [Deinococcus betulae]
MLPWRGQRDPLTGLWQRAALETLPQPGPGALALVAVNSLQHINEERSWKAGNRLIRAAALHLRRALPSTALLARWNGDTLLAVVPGLSLVGLDLRLCELPRRVPTPLPDQPAVVYGLSEWRGGADLSRAVTVADHDLYLAKGAGEVSTQALGEERGLFDFSVELAHLTDPEDIIRRGLRLTRQLLQFEGAIYTILEGESFRSVYQETDPALAFTTFEVGRLYPLTGLGLQAVRERRTVVSVDLHNDPRTAGRARTSQLRSLMVTPVECGGRVVGMLGLFQISTWRAMPPRVQRVLELAALRLGHALELKGAVSAVRRTLEGGLLGLGVALEARDLETHGHTRRVVEASVRLGQALGLEGETLDQLRQGAYLHDIGKLSIPDRILLKPSRLTPEEWRVMQSHALTGASFAAHIPSLSAGALRVICSHHERWDGQGYPEGLAGEQIPLLARIFAICDVYDALTSERPYKHAWTTQAACAEIAAQAGRQFDPQVTEVFLRLSASLSTFWDLRAEAADLARPGQAD